MHVDSCSVLRFERAVCLEPLVIFFFLLSPLAVATTKVEQSRRGKGNGGADILPTIRRKCLRLLGGLLVHRKGEVQLDRHCASQGHSSENPHFFILEGV